MIVPTAVNAAPARRGRIVAILAGLIAACGVAALLVACGGEETAPPDEPGQQETSAPASTPVAASPDEPGQERPAAPPRAAIEPVQLLVTEAAALERNGYWEQALSVRASAIQSGSALDEGDRIRLRLDNARLLLKLDRPADAQAALLEIDGSGSREAARRILLLSAQAALMLDQTDAALTAMQDYVNSDSPAWAVISLELARTLQRAGRGAEAIEWAQRAQGGMLPLQDELRAIHLTATELDIAGETEPALAAYDELLARSPWRDDQAAALSRIGALRRDAGELEFAQAAWTRLVDEYREYPESVEALAFLLDSGQGPSQLTIGRIRFEEGRWAEARTAMLNVLGGSDILEERVAAEFIIAAIHEVNGDPDSAALGYAAVIERDASDPLAAESMMRMAEFALAQDDVFTAESYWRRVMTEHPQHARAEEAARRWAMQAVAAGRWAEAAQRFREAADAGAEFWPQSAQLELRYWSALMHAQAGDLETASELASSVIEAQPGSYAGLRAAALIDAEPPQALEISLDEWLVRLTGEATPPRVELESAAEWLAAQDLRLGGFDDAADRMLGLWIDELASNPWSLAGAARFLAARDEASASARAAERLLAVFGLEWAEAPVELLRLAYPQPWPDVMALHAGAEGVDPLLLWSLIRRESLYDPDAAGLAEEVGLTQVIPLTGSDIAAGLGITYQHADLARPELSIRFGAWYLARQLEGFSDEPLMALAAYNAGPGNAARWEDEALLPGPDAFLAAMDFSSTRMYVRYVLQALAAYRAAYPAAE